MFWRRNSNNTFLKYGLFKKTCCRLLFLLSVMLFSHISARGALLFWPTPSDGFAKGAPYEAYILPTSEKIESGMFGSVRNNGFRFHEGIDIKPVRFNDAKQPIDPIYAMSDGVVVHVNQIAADSSYGRYIVVIHENFKPAVYTLYAHLEMVAPGIFPGTQVRGGQRIGIIGATSGTYKMTQDQTHLHFEVGLRLSDNFDGWYTLQDFDTSNKHGLWNGVNLVGVDPVAFLKYMLKSKELDSEDFIKQLPQDFKIRIHTKEIPDYVKRYPQFLTKSYQGENLMGWDIGFTWFGLPVEWTPLHKGDHPSGKQGSMSVISYNQSVLKANPSKKMIGMGKKITVEKDLQKHMEILFETLRKKKKK